MTPSEREVVEEVEKETSIVVPPPYNPPISFLQIFVEANVDAQSKRYMDNIHTNSPLSEVLHKKRKIEDHETREIISIKKGRLTFEMVGEITKTKNE